MSNVIKQMLQVQNTDTTLCEMLSHMTRVVGFVSVAIIIYSPFNRDWINKPVGGWDANRTDDSWGNYRWNWDWIDCMYFSMVTMTTVGYGDHPTLTQELRIFTMFFALTGVLVVAKSITVIADWFAAEARKRFIAKQRVLLKDAIHVAETVRSELHSFQEGQEGKVEDGSSPRVISPKRARVISPKRSRLELDKVDVVPFDTPQILTPRDEHAGRGAAIDVGGAVPPSPPPSPSQVVPYPISAQTDAADESGMVTPRKQADGRGRWWKGLSGRLPDRKLVCGVLKALRLTGVYFCLCIILGELENMQIEGCGRFGAGWACGSTGNCEAWKLSHELGEYCWSWIDQFYYGVITYVTIGYGDVKPHTKGGKALASLLVVMGVFSFTTMLAELNDLQQAKRLGADKTIQQRIDELNEVIAQDDDGKVSAEEYIIFNLKKMGSVDDETLALLRDQFKALDADGSGELDSGDITMLEEAAAHLDREQEARELARERELAAGAGGDGGGGVKMLWPRK